VVPCVEQEHERCHAKEHQLILRAEWKIGMVIPYFHGSLPKNIAETAEQGEFEPGVLAKDIALWCSIHRSTRRTEALNAVATARSVMSQKNSPPGAGPRRGTGAS